MNAKQKLLMTADKVKQAAMMVKLGQDLQCTSFPDGPWSNCCWYHDLGCAYAKLEQNKKIRRQLRKEADKNLKLCVQKQSHKLGNIMYFGVRSYALLRRILKTD